VKKQRQQEQEAGVAGAARAADDAELTAAVAGCLSAFCLFWLCCAGMCCGDAVPGWPARRLLCAVPCYGLATATWVKGMLPYAMRV